jgi:AGCS family alanine or glycine:cation symporter
MVERLCLLWKTNGEFMFQALEEFSGQFVGLVWGIPLITLLFGAGAVFTIYFAFPQIRHFFHAWKIAFGVYDKPEDKGEINHLQALTAALSATLGLGNIAGVAVAIAAGGPGAVFWMWVAGFLGMATKFTSVSLSLLFRDTSGTEVHGGPMYTIKKGLGKAFGPLATIYALFAILSSFGAGNMFQSNQLSSIIHTTVGVPAWVSGLFFTAMAWMVLVGGIKRIGKVTEALVPSMVFLYVGGALGIIFANIEKVPELLGMIVNDAFTGTAAVGGFAGVAFREVLVQGVRRGVFSNEAGMGSAAMAHSAAKSDPLQEGFVALLGPFIDTLVVCTMTALVLLITGVWSNTGGLEGSDLTAAAFETLYGGAGVYIIMIVVVLFAFSTIVAWSYYGEQGVTFLFGEKYIIVYRYIFLAFIMLGAILELKVVLNLSDAVFGLLAIPNLIANIMLSKKLKGELKNYEKNVKPNLVEGKMHL